jgi:hypothetical protein
VRSWGLLVQEQEEVWARWRQGASLRLIARRLGKRGPSVRAFVLQTGGVPVELRHPRNRRLRSGLPRAGLAQQTAPRLRSGRRRVRR